MAGRGTARAAERRAGGRRRLIKGAALRNASPSTDKPRWLEGFELPSQPPEEGGGRTFFFKKKDGRAEKEKYFSTCIMSINNPPLKWQERKGWNALGGEESRVGLFLSFHFSFLFHFLFFSFSVFLSSIFKPFIFF